MNSIGSDVEAACRLGDEQHLHVAGELAGDDDLLLVAARQVSTPALWMLGVRTS